MATLTDRATQALNNTKIPAVVKKAMGLFGMKLLPTHILQRDYMFEVMLPQIDYIAGTDIAKFCQDINIGEEDFDEVYKIKYNSFNSSQPGFTSIQNISLTFVKPVPDLVMEYFSLWKTMIVDGRGNYYPKSNYAKNVKVTLYETTGKISDSYKFSGCFPVKFAKHALSYGSEKVITYTVELNADRVYREYDRDDLFNVKKKLQKVLNL